MRVAKLNAPRIRKVERENRRLEPRENNYYCRLLRKTTQAEQILTNLLLIPV
jgi:hypothetical protein